MAPGALKGRSPQANHFKPSVPIRHSALTPSPSPPRGPLLYRFDRDRILGSMKSLKVHFLTFGCQMNKYDSGMVAGLLHDRGAQLVDSAEEAEVLVINTCSVRAHAEDRVYSLLGHVKRRKRRQPGLLVAVIGCTAQKEGRRLAERFPCVDLVVGTRRLDELPRLL